ncbi:hypothetical protein IBTHAUMO2_560004 [Nitrosopumilaceae archaeon]|nr:hypothetical protein [Nitrosopumilus sp.]MDA7997079.1 hypothetical protein [Nitrosopumilus sp.]CAI9832030.1 hypothetical protein IBTHAUMO2_560004 [Nitrosopumilaceae archaeon]
MGSLLDKLEEKKSEADRFAKKYEARKMADLEEYYKGASWAFEYAIKAVRDEGSSG